MFGIVVQTIIVIAPFVAVVIFCRKYFDTPQSQPGPDEPTAKGNQLITAARDGRIGLTEEQIGIQQKKYIRATGANSLTLDCALHTPAVTSLEIEENMNSEELIRKGNQIIAGIRAGEIGLSEDEVRRLQGFYGNRHSFRNTAIAIIVIGAGIFVVNFSQYMSRPAFDLSSYEALELLASSESGSLARQKMGTVEQSVIDGIQNQHEMIFGAILAMAGFIALSYARNRATKYVELASLEYTKLEKKKVA
jgi:hypothetical protein